MTQTKKKFDLYDTGTAAGRLELAATGMESEFEVVLDGEPSRPEEVFGDPRAFLRGPLMHRVGTSYHLPTGGAVYFDTGVIEVATPVIELGRGCAARAGRSLWESIRIVRSELDAWERESGHDLRLRGFSTHYNVSFELDRRQQGTRRTVQKLALLLAYILPMPVMVLATNRRSTGVGVRPRGDRIEITADFTPSPALMIATGTLITGIVRAVMEWPSFELEALDEEAIPVVAGFRPAPHSSRKGWVARPECFHGNPFQCDIDAPAWTLRDGSVASLREVAGRVARRFWPEIERVADPFTLRLIGSVLDGRAPALLDLADRPPEYDDVGRACAWDELFPERELERSWYERVLIRAISGEKLRLFGATYTPVGMKGWSQVEFVRDADGSAHHFALDFLVRRLDEWERPRRGVRLRGLSPFRAGGKFPLRVLP